jgi:hypothetical protein
VLSSRPNSPSWRKRLALPFRASNNRTARNGDLALRLSRIMLGAGGPRARHYDPALSRPRSDPITR